MWWKRTVGEWQQVRDSKIWELREEGSGILPALRLSYKHLPPHLKLCFAFCSIYPKDFKMDREQLIYLWMANGYLQSNGTMELEAFGKLVFDELVRRSFFQEFEIETELGIEISATCKMHDLMHDLACLVSANECSVVEVGSANGIVNCTRHMSLVFDLETEVESSKRCVSLVKSNSRLRTLFLSGSYMSKIGPAYILENLYSLRALDFRKVGIETLPNSIGKMKLLKYLNLAGSRVELLPESICKLRNLKCLILRDCRSLQSLPKGMSKMRGLRHLDIWECYGLSEMPSGMEQLTQLQTLRGFFVVGPESGIGVINGLKGMQQLRGGLWIKGLEHVREAEADLVKGTQHLSVLWLSYSSGRDTAAGELQEKVLEECLQPHPDLKELRIAGYGGANLPSWMGELQNVVTITLEDCMSCERLPAIGRLHTTSWFPSLQQLQIEKMGSLEEWSLPSAAKEKEEEESSHRHHPRAFPCLKELTIIDCLSLKAIPCLPCVQNIRLQDCNEMILRSIPKLPPRSLLTLVIESFQEMTHLPEGTFINSSSSALQSLEISRCHKLKSVSGEIQNLTSLTSLKISYCNELELMSRDDQEEDGFQHLISLQSLTLRDLPKLRALPEGMQHLTMLKSLSITKCENLRMLPEWLQHLTSLQSLEIRGCHPDLHKRCDKDKGEDWHIISHIPQLINEVVYGRDDDKKKIIEILLNSVRCGEDLSVLPIIGMGGIGKTTVAQWVYNDSKVISHFDERAWVCVSDNFAVKHLMKMILASLDVKTCDPETLDSLQRQLQGKLSGKKFLLVLDDVWNEDQEKWENLKSVLKCGAQGSFIIVTTRLEPVASMMKTLPSCPVTCLSEEESWLLFKDCAFAPGKEGREEVDNLVEIGTEIVKKCVGVPLALKSLGRLMWWKRTVGEWQQVRDSKIWELREEGSRILPALRLSYEHLPPHLKQCFAFCSIYPKNFKMDREQLIYLWMANGYLQSNGTMELEAFGKRVFDELVSMCFFQEFEIDTEEGIEISATCKMHVLMHDLACLVSANECSVVEVGSANGIVNCTKHMSLVFDLETEVESSNRCVSLVKSNSRLCTLFLSGSYMSKIGRAYILENLYSLRALDLSEVGIETLPIYIGKMEDLEYLNLAGSSVELLPESICKLRNLKCLILRYCRSLRSLPKGMSKMRGLRHLDIWECYGLSEMPSGMEQLTQLQTLRGFFDVGPESGTRVINGLKGMQQLRGTLWIRGLEHVREAEADLVKGTQHLSVLGLKYSSDRDTAAGELQEKVLEECLQPHPNLKKLLIAEYGGANLPSWMGELQNVVKISLAGCKSCVRLPALGRLPLLKFLCVEKMNSLKCIDDDFYGEGVGGRGGSAATNSWFPSLQLLQIEEMDSLEEWSLPSAAKEEESSHRHHPRAFPCLEELNIWWCPKLKAIPCLPCVQNIRLTRCNEMILRSIPKLPPRSLLTLEIDHFEEMTHLPEGTFINSSSSALQSLEISRCHKLKSVSGLDSLSELEGLLGKLTSLTQLSIEECPSLEHLPVMGIQGFNNSLKELKIWGCDKLASVSEGLQYLTSLQILNIGRCPNLELMPRDDQEEDGFQHLISLQTLTLGFLPKLRALPEGMQHLTMLKSLEISSCKNLRMLPEWLQHLTSLQSLKIKYCHPDLHKRCDKDKGEDWHIISHIPQLIIVFGD